MSAELVLRTAIAGLGIACVATGFRVAGRNRALEHRAPGAGGHAVLRALDGLVPLAARSQLLRREAALTTTWRRIVLARSTSHFAGFVGAWLVRREARARGHGGAQPSHHEDLRDTMAAARAACVLAAFTLAIPLAFVVGPWVGGVAVVLALAAGRAPDGLLAFDARRAARRVEAAMPAALELLAACCRGGLALEAALAVAASHTSEPLRGVLDRARRRQRAGQSPSAALRLEAEATGLDEVAAIGRLIERHHLLGLPLEGPFLARAQAAAARARVGALARAGRGVPLASLLVAAVIAPCCVGVLATWVVVALVGQTGFA